MCLPHTVTVQLRPAIGKGKGRRGAGLRDQRLGTNDKRKWGQGLGTHDKRKLRPLPSPANRSTTTTWSAAPITVDAADEPLDRSGGAEAYSG